MKNLLFELGVEELPIKEVKLLSESLKANLAHGLREHKLEFADIKSFATPRRIAVLINNLVEKAPDQNIERRGPAVSAKEAAKIGFAKSCATELEKLETIDTDKGQYLVYRAKQNGELTKNIIGNLINSVLKKLPVKRAMRWGDHDYAFARPVHWAVLLYGDEVISNEFFGINSNNFTFGHRFLSPEKIIIKNPDDYEKLLEKAFVIADFNKRRELIKNLVLKEAANKKLIPDLDDELLDDVTSLVEWPVALVGEFNKEYLEVPKECLITSMRVNQKYFALFDALDSRLRGNDEKSSGNNEQSQSNE